MWVVAGILLGVVVLATLVGLHTGPHTHVAAGAVGLVAAGWLAFMAVDLAARPLVLSLLAADVVVSGGVGFAATRAFSAQRRQPAGGSLHALEGSMGVAVGALAPAGIVRVRGENWSATSLNGPIPKGSAVQVIAVEGVRLSVWGEETAVEPMLGDSSPSDQHISGTPTGETDRLPRGAETGGPES